MDVSFAGEIIHWRGPAPHYFVEVPAALCEQVADAAARVSYGWGVVPVSARLGDTDFTTSLFPKDGGYLVPIKARVRAAESVDEGDIVDIGLRIDD